MNAWLISFIVAFLFLVRGIFVPTFWLRGLFFLLCLAATLTGLIFFKEAVSTDVVQGVSLILLGSSILFLAADLSINGYRFIRNFLLVKFRLMPVLPKYLKEIVRAYQVLASKRTGALIVLEGKDSLNSYVDTRTQFDSEIKAELLTSIFNTSSPLHDGALVVHRGRIKAARVVLPVSTQASVPIEMGTRHRSAISISEKTDAIALVVSEERGTMSVVYRGALVVSKSPEHFAQLLATALRGKPIGVFAHATTLHSPRPVRI